MKTAGQPLGAKGIGNLLPCQEVKKPMGRLGKPLRAAIFVDAENQADLDIPDLMQRLGRLDVVAKQAYADWRNRRLTSISQRLAKEGFERHRVWSGDRPGARKNTADGCMARGIRQALVQIPQIELVIIVSGDAFFVPLVGELRERSVCVIVAADPLCVSRELVVACSQYLPIGGLVRSLEELHRLGSSSRYLTFRYAAEKLGIGEPNLARMIHRKYLLQGLISRPARGIRPEIWLNPRSEVVRTALGVTA